MSIFDSIKNAIFGSKAQASTPAASAAPARAPAPAPAAAAPRPVVAAPAAPAQVDIEAVMKGFEAQSKQKLNWRSSIVDLLKLLDLDSSLEHRKALAKELGYTGDTNDSATMNVWLHKQVMKKLAENGGLIPASLIS